MIIDPLIGLGISFLFGFGRWLFPAVPSAISIVGVISGVVILAAGFTPDIYKPPLASLLLASLGAIALAAAGHIYWQHIMSEKQPLKEATSTSSPPQGIGGAGGNAVVHGSGAAIGGPGGRVTGLGRGIGGSGGSAEVKGDGSAAGGAGGAVGTDRYWPAPAKSGYEMHQRALGLPVDPSMRPYGRGGSVAGYEPKLAVIEQLREAYFRQNRASHKTIFEDINAVPLEYLNNSLEADGLLWRVLIVDNEYEFLIP